MPGEFKGDTPEQESEEVIVGSKQSAPADPLLEQGVTATIDQIDMVNTEDETASLPEMLPSVVIDKLVTMRLTQSPMSKYGDEYLEALNNPVSPDHMMVQTLQRLHGLWYGVRTGAAVDLGLLDQKMTESTRNLITKFGTLSEDEQDYQTKHIFRNALTMLGLIGESRLIATKLLESEAPREMIHRFIAASEKGRIGDLTSDDRKTIATSGERHSRDKECDLVRPLEAAAEEILLIREAQRRQAGNLEGIQRDSSERRAKWFQQFDELLKAIE